MGEKIERVLTHSVDGGRILPNEDGFLICQDCKLVFGRLLDVVQ